MPSPTPASPPTLPPLPRPTGQHTGQLGRSTSLPASSSELSDLQDSTPSISSSEEEDEEPSEEDEEPESESSSESSDEQSRRMAEKTASATLAFWESKRRHRYGFRHFLKGYLLTRTRKNRKPGQRICSVVRALRTPSVRRCLEKAGVQLRFKGEANSQIVDIPAFRKELFALKSESAFGHFEPEALTAPGADPRSVKDVCNATWSDEALESAWSQIQAKSPKIGAFLSDVFAARRAGRPSYKPTQVENPFQRHVPRAYMVASLLLSASGSHSSLLPMSLGIYLHSSGVPRRVIDTLSRFGICRTYKSVLDETKRTAKGSLVNTGSLNPTAEPGLSWDIEEPPACRS
ncbi:hypothetical protein F5Y05DRAFT_390715 [Hypoxylon sp. FL0543]|nr:hypothetical protein F5Y05DRAFT_390715 [Hypoxylon sp. FL0543]